jgi:hypothetical protein
LSSAKRIDFVKADRNENVACNHLDKVLVEKKTTKKNEKEELPLYKKGIEKL